MIRAAMAATKTAGISRLLLARRERAVMLVPEQEGILLWTLRFGDEVRAEEDCFAGIGAEKPAAPALKLVRRPIKDAWRTETRRFFPTRCRSGSPN